MSTLATIKFDYGIQFTKDQQLEIKSLAFIADFTVKDEPAWIWQTVTMLIEDAMKFGKFTVESIAPYHIIDRMTHFQQRTATEFNNKCNVVVPGLGTLTIDTVKVCNDICTEALQEELEKGWKIVAVCVQPDQRRPDYILGKTTKS